MMVTVIDESYHHLPYHQRRPALIGQTLRQALRGLRAVDWGNIGGGSLELSDGSELGIYLKPAAGGGEVMSSQAAYRVAPGGERIRRYSLR